MGGGSGKCGVGVGVFKIPLPHHHSVSPTPTPRFPLPLQISTPYLGLHSPHLRPTPWGGAVLLPTPLTSKKRNDWIWSTSAGLRLRRLRTGERCYTTIPVAYSPHTKDAIAHSAWRQIVPTPYLIIIHTKVKRGREIRCGATPNSAPLQRLTGQGRERIPLIL